MIYLFIALYPEAKPVIQALQLKRRQPLYGFDFYEGSNLRLILTGSGSLSAATAVSAALTYGKSADCDLLLNWGSCGSTVDIGKVFLCHRLIDRITRRIYYPDLLIRTHLPETTVITEPEPYLALSDNHVDNATVSNDAIARPHMIRNSGSDKQSQTVLHSGSDNQAQTVLHSRPDKQSQTVLHSRSNIKSQSPFDSSLVLHDMEAAAIYFAGSYFMAPDQMHFLKVITDFGIADLTMDKLSAIMEQSTPALLEYIAKLEDYERILLEKHMIPLAGHTVSSSALPYSDSSVKYDPSAIVDVDLLSDEFRCSRTMRASLEQYVRYWTIAGIDFQRELLRMHSSGELPCASKREGVKRLEQLKTKLL